jgi:long-chain acyl-CoA synthetase
MTDLRESSGLSYVRGLLRKEIDHVNHELAPHERVRAFDLLPEPPSIEAGTLTPTLKVRRAMLEAVHADRIAALYDGRRR